MDGSISVFEWDKCVICEYSDKPYTSVWFIDMHTVKNHRFWNKLLFISPYSKIDQSYIISAPEKMPSFTMD